MNELDKTIEVDTNLVQELINYLQSRPYVEVYQLINKIMIEAEKAQNKDK